MPDNVVGCVLGLTQRAVQAFSVCIQIVPGIRQPRVEDGEVVGPGGTEFPRPSKLLQYGALVCLVTVQL